MLLQQQRVPLRDHDDAPVLRVGQGQHRLWKRHLARNDADRIDPRLLGLAAYYVCRRNLLVAVAVGAGSLIVLNYLR